MTMNLFKRLVIALEKIAAKDNSVGFIEAFDALIEAQRKMLLELEESKHRRGLIMRYKNLQHKERHHKDDLTESEKREIEIGKEILEDENGLIR